MTELEMLKNKLDAAEKQIQRLVEEKSKLEKRFWVNKFQQEIAELNEQLATKEVLLADALDKIEGFMMVTAP